MYRQGPHAEGTPQQGYQSPLTPQEIFRVAIREINHHLGKPFEKLVAKEQDEVLKNLEEGKLALKACRRASSSTCCWRARSRASSPIRLRRQPTRPAGWWASRASRPYTTAIDKAGVPYQAEPVSIVDMLRTSRPTSTAIRSTMLTRKD